MKNRITLLLLLTSLSLVACRKQIEPVVEPEPEPYVCPYGTEFADISGDGIVNNGMFPLHINNYWTYADTARDENGVVVGTGEVVVRPTRLRITGEDIWWSFNDVYGTLNQKGDSVFYLENTFPYGCLNKRLEYFPVGTDTLNFWSVVEGDILIDREAVLKQDTVFTPAGDFTDCLYFGSPHFTGTQLIKPGIGFVEVFYPPYWEGPSHTYTLVDYHLE